MGVKHLKKLSIGLKLRSHVISHFSPHFAGFKSRWTERARPAKALAGKNQYAKEREKIMSGKMEKMLKHQKSEYTRAQALTKIENMLDAAIQKLQAFENNF